MTSLKLLAYTVLFMGGLSSASASLIALGPRTFATGISSLPTVLTIQNAGTASGCVGFIAGMDVTGLAACPGGFTGSGGNEIGDSTMTGTRTIAELNAGGIRGSDKLLLVFHSGEPGGGSITIEDLAVTFFDVANDITFTASVLGLPMTLASTAPRASNNTGFAFGLDAFEAGLAAEFFSNPENRIGAAATLSGSAGGVNTFVLTSPPAAAIPEPRTFLGIGSGLLLIALLRTRSISRSLG